MDFIFLSEDAEQLLKEIIKLNETSSNEQITNWENRFNNLSINKDERLRSVFSELIDLKFVNIQWGDGIPYHIFITNKSYNYWDDKNRKVKERKRLSRREWLIALVSAIIGALIGLIPYITNKYIP